MDHLALKGLASNWDDSLDAVNPRFDAIPTWISLSNASVEASATKITPLKEKIVASVEASCSEERLAESSIKSVQVKFSAAATVSIVSPTHLHSLMLMAPGRDVVPSGQRESQLEFPTVSLKVPAVHAVQRF